MSLPVIDAGKRVIVAGRTGSGKSTLACWLLEHNPQHWIILNPKHTNAYKNLSDVIVFTKFDEPAIRKEIQRTKFVLLNFSGDEASADFMDDVILWAHGTLKNIGLCADELYTLHSASGRAGDGLIGWLTRGRELKQSFIGLTQRPAWISRFVVSEADAICAMDLVLADDRMRMRESTGQDHFLNRIRDHRWLWYSVAEDKLTLYGPVPV